MLKHITIMNHKLSSLQTPFALLQGADRPLVDINALQSSAIRESVAF